MMNIVKLGLLIDLSKNSNLIFCTSKFTTKNNILSRDQSRALVKSKFGQGITNATNISKETGVSIRTVYRYLSQLKTTGKISEKNRSGRPRKNTKNLHRQLGQIKRMKPRTAAHLYAKDLTKKNKTSISTSTVQRALHQMGYHWKLPGRKILSQAQKISRLNFAKAHIGDDWSETWSFDEAYFNLYRHSNKCWISTTTEEVTELPKLKTRQEKISVGICFAFSRSGKSALGFLPKNWTGSDSVNIFKETLLPSIAWPEYPSQKQRFIIDNDGRHQMDVFKNFIKKYRIHPLTPWPSNSPDLNPIENIFAWMKQYVENQLPSTEATLRQAIIDAFNNLSVGHFANLIDSMETRLKAVVKSKGSRINY